VLVGADDAVDGDDQPGRHQDRTRQVEPTSHRLARRVPPEEHPGRDQPDGADRHVYEQDPAPRRLGGEEPAEDRAGGAPGAGQRTPQADRLGPPGTFREGAHQDREGRRREHGPAEALYRTGDQQGRAVRGEPAHQAGRGEQAETGQEYPTLPEQVGGPAAEQQEPGEGEGVGVDHPLKADRAEVKVRTDRGQRDVDD